MFESNSKELTSVNTNLFFALKNIPYMFLRSKENILSIWINLEGNICILNYLAN